MKVVGKIFAILSSIFYFFILIILLIIAFSLNLLSADYYTDIIKSVDLKTVKISDLGESFDNDKFEEDATVEDVLVKYFEEGGVEPKVAAAVIDNEKIREVLGKFIGDYINYRVGGKKPEIKKEDIKAIFDEPDVKKLLEQSPEKIEVNIDKIYNQLNELVDEVEKGKGNDYDNTERNINNTIISN